MRKRRPSAQTVKLLAALAVQPSSWRHGYDLSRELGLASGTLYPLLMRLHDRGWLEAEWEAAEQPGRPPRHVYRLTPEGLDYAKAMEAGGYTLAVRHAPRTAS